MKLSEITKSMYDWCDVYPKARDSLFNFWYTHSALDLARVLLHAEGSKVIVNVSQFNDFETVVRRLLLFSDILALRDTREFPKEPVVDLVPVPDDFASFERPVLSGMKPPPVMRIFEGGYVSSATKIELPNGRSAHVAVGQPQVFPRDTYDWIFGAGRPYIETGQVIYAPFIPPVEIELEFLRQGVSLPQTLGALPLFSGKADWFDEKAVAALLLLDIPTLENVDLPLLQKVKQEHHDEFMQFRNTILTAVTKIESTVGSDSFMQEVRHIQRNDIDYNLAKLRTKMEHIAKMRTLRASGCLVGSVGLTFSAILGVWVSLKQQL